MTIYLSYSAAAGILRSTVAVSLLNPMARTIVRLFAPSVAIVALSTLVGGASVRPTRVAQGFIRSHDGLKLAYRTVGTGPQAVVVPLGFMMSAFERLATPERTLIFFDQRNRGRSDAVDPERLSIHDEARDIESVRSHLGRDKISLIGYSYVGLLVMLYTLEHPDRVDRVVQLAPVPIRFGTEFPPESRSDDREQALGTDRLASLNALLDAGMDEKEPAAYCRKQWDVFKFGLVARPENSAALGAGYCDLPNEWPLAFKRMWPHRQAEMKALDLTTRLSRIHQPVLTLHGRKDRNSPFGAGREWAATLPNARFIPIQNAAHQSWADEPDLVFGAIDRFLKGAWPADAQR